MIPANRREVKFILPQLPKQEYQTLQSLVKALDASQVEVVGLGIRLLVATWKVAPETVLALLSAKRMEPKDTGGPVPTADPYDPNKPIPDTLYRI